jgi:hypothetical protein
MTAARPSLTHHSGALRRSGPGTHEHRPTAASHQRLFEKSTFGVHGFRVRPAGPPSEREFIIWRSS